MKYSSFVNDAIIWKNTGPRLLYIILVSLAQFLKNEIAK